jgi:hypothetical protein
MLLNTLFSNTLSLCSYPNVRDQVSHPYRTTGKIIVLYILIFMFLDSRREAKGSGLNGSKHYPSSISKVHLYLSTFAPISTDLRQRRECHSDITNSCVHGGIIDCKKLKLRRWGSLEILWKSVVKNLDLITCKFAQSVGLVVRGYPLWIPVRTQNFITQINCSQLSIIPPNVCWDILI